MYKYLHFDAMAANFSPVEIAFIILWARARDSKLIETTILEEQNQEIDDSEVSRYFTWECTYKDYDQDDHVSVQIEFYWKGGYYGGSDPSWDHPGDDPTTYVSDIEIETFKLYLAKDDEWIDVDDKLVKEADAGFTFQNMLDLGILISEDYLEFDENNATSYEDAFTRIVGKKAREKRVLKNGKPEIEHIPAVPGLNFPLKLQHKMDEIKNSTKHRMTVASRRYGL